jgi:hypothetical protein
LHHVDVANPPFRCEVERLVAARILKELAKGDHHGGTVGFGAFDLAIGRLLNVTPCPS